jgi:MFS family permease
VSFSELQIKTGEGLKMNNLPGQKSEPSPLYRWLVLFFISMAMFGNYYIYDSISPLADLLKSQLGFTDGNIGLLNAIYSIPNIFMVLIGGYIIDRIGTKKASILFSSLCLIGTVITALKGDLATMATGRLIFGLGAESLIVTVTTVIAKWFKGKELSFAFGLNLTIARLGSFAALNSPTLAKSLFASWQKPLFISVVAGVISVAAVIIYFSMESQASRRFVLGAAGDVDKIPIGSFFSTIKELNRSAFWYITLLCVTFYSAIFPFQTFAVKFFIEHHGISREMADIICAPL